MNTDNDLEKRIRTLESQLAFLRGAASVTAACVLAFLGYTIIGIPKQITAKVNEKIGTDTLARVEAFNRDYDKLRANADSFVRYGEYMELQPENHGDRSLHADDASNVMLGLRNFSLASAEKEHHWKALRVTPK